MDAIDPRIAIVTLGCAKNEVDSQEMATRLFRAGYALEPDPAAADAIIINTCSFIQAATEESIDTFFAVAGLENVETDGARIIVAGCMPARYGDALEAELNEASAFVPCSREDDIVSVIAGLFPDRVPIPREPDPDDTVGAREYATTAIGDNPWCAYVKISDGCDRMCSYCTIPFIRGRYHSYPLDEIKEDVNRKVSAGVREITLIAQDTGRWGRDFKEPASLAYLVDELATAFPATWFRVMYIQPEGITDELLDVIHLRANVCSYLDIPLQHANADIIRAMNRKGDAEVYRGLIERIRTKVPGITLRTTVIAGFPGETDEQFDELMSFLEEAEFDYVGVFPYSREEGTRAARLSEQVEEGVKQERVQAVRDLCDSLSAHRISKRIGMKMPVLVLGSEEDGQVYGRAQCQAQEVDGVTFLDGGEPGMIVEIEVTDTLMYEMEGEISV